MKLSVPWLIVLILAWKVLCHCWGLTSVKSDIWKFLHGSFLTLKVPTACAAPSPANKRKMRQPPVSSPLLQSGKFGPSDAPESQPQGIQTAEDAAEHENMKAVLKSSLQGGESGTSTVPGLRTRTRASSTRGQSHYHVTLPQLWHHHPITALRFAFFWHSSGFTEVTPDTF